MASWDMFRELEHLRREIDEAFHGAGVGRLLAPPFLTSGAGRFPLVNLSEDSGNFYLQALLPGVEPQGVDITILRNTLTIAGERKPHDPADKEVVWHRNERGTGKFTRTIELPSEVDAGRVTAQSSNGVLRVTIAKSEAAKSKKIQVTGA
jgi:HSP20 family protein